MKLLSFALAATVAVTAALPAAAQPYRHRHHGGRACHTEYRHHHRVEVCHRR